MDRALHFAVLAAATGLLFGALVAPRPLSAQPAQPERLPPEQRPSEIIDLLTFAQGAVPIAVDGPGIELGAGFEQAINAIDGDPTNRTLYRRPAGPDTSVTFTYALPSSTTFEGFMVPAPTETPSPSQTFTRQIVVQGSAAGADGPWTTLAEAGLPVPSPPAPHIAIDPTEVVAVRWVRISLTGGNEEGATFFEFNELIGFGTQEPVARVDHFTGLWDATGGTLALTQDGATVTGCADRGRKLVEGTVDGNLLYATLTDVSSGIGGAMILAVLPSGDVWGVRSDNGSPFRVYGGGASTDGTAHPCESEESEGLGCGSVIHGIHFAFDSAEILAESSDVLDALYEGLVDTEGTIGIEGHTSTEGEADYNQSLSERRAAAVVDALSARGIAADRLHPTGRGEDEPIAREDTEAGRALNRRVEVHCATE